MFKIDIFCCYAREDQQYLLKLRKHLIPLQRQGLIVLSSDVDISPGSSWEEEIDKYLKEAQVIRQYVK